MDCQALIHRLDHMPNAMPTSVGIDPVPGDDIASIPNCSEIISSFTRFSFSTISKPEN
jgi:hypothetical protein